jgi:hypothetical protein
VTAGRATCRWRDLGYRSCVSALHGLINEQSYVRITRHRVASLQVKPGYLDGRKPDGERFFELQGLR